MNCKRKCNNLRSNNSNNLSTSLNNDKTPQKSEEDKIVWFTSPPMDKLKHAKLNLENSCLKPKDEISSIVKLIRKSDNSSDNQKENFINQTPVSNIWLNEVSTSNSKLNGKSSFKSSILDSPSFQKQKHSHCLDYLFSPTNKKSKVNHWSNGLKGKLIKENYFKNENILDIENSLLFKKNTSKKLGNNYNNNSNEIIRKNNLNNNDNSKYLINKSYKKDRVKSEPILFSDFEEERKKKKLIMPKYNSLLNFEKIPFDSENVNLGELLKKSIISEPEEIDKLTVKKRKIKNDNENDEDNRIIQNKNIDNHYYKDNVMVDNKNYKSIQSITCNDNNELSNSSNKENNIKKNIMKSEKLFNIKQKNKNIQEYTYNQ
eukprot:jgi/Orpsp1_1/1187201/evm.model.d7180000056085.1